MGSVGIQPLQLEAMRARLCKMSDADPLRFGRATASLCRPKKQSGHPPLRVFVEQLQEARTEWRCRHPKALFGNRNELAESIRSEKQGLVWIATKSPARDTARELLLS